MSTYTPNKNLDLPAHNASIDTWDTPVNADFGLIDTALGGSVSLNSTGLSGDQTLATASYQPLTIFITGTPAAAVTYVVPSGVGGQWVFVNGTSGGFNVGIKSAAGGSTILVPAASNTLVSCNGAVSGMRLSVNVAPAAAGSTTQLQYNSGGLLAGSANLTFDGTTLTGTGLNVGGNSVLGLNSGSTLTLNGSTATIPNGLTIGTGNLLVLNQSSGLVGIGTATLVAGNLLTVAGNIKITTGGLIFPDGTQLLSASALGSSGLSGAVQISDGASGFSSDSVFSYNSGTHTLSSTNLTVSGTVTTANATISGTLTLAALAAGSPFTGMCFWFAGIAANIPTSTLLCFGQAVSRATFSALFGKIGTTWGVGDGSTTFNVPDFRGRVPAGDDAMGGSAAGRLGGGTTGGITGTAAIGAVGGEQGHTQAAGELVQHTHTMNAVTGSNAASSGGPVQGSGATGTSGTTPASAATAMNVTQPTIVGNWVIFT